MKGCDSNTKRFDLLCAVVNKGKAAHVLKIAKCHGIHGATVFLGRGTLRLSRISNFLELTDTKREIVLMVTERSSCLEAMEFIAKEMDFPRRHSGICFSLPVQEILGIVNLAGVELDCQEANRTVMYNAIFTIVEKGMAEDVIDAAVSAGARGGTIISARGSGIHETETVFAMPIEPEREIVMIVTRRAYTAAISAAIRKKLRIDEPARGIIFILGVGKAYGLADG